MFQRPHFGFRSSVSGPEGFVPGGGVSGCKNGHVFEAVVVVLKALLYGRDIRAQLRSASRLWQ